MLYIMPSLFVTWHTFSSVEGPLLSLLISLIARSSLEIFPSSIAYYRWRFITPHYRCILYEAIEDESGFNLPSVLYFP